MKKFFDALDRGLCVVLFLSGFVAFAIVMGNVTTRYLINIPVAWSNEVAEIIAIWLAFLGGAKAVRLQVHLGMPDIIERLSKGLQRLTHVVVAAIIILTEVVMIYAGVHLSVANFQQEFPVTHFPTAVEYLALPVGTFLALLFTLEGLGNLFTREEEKGTDRGPFSI